ncbi:hypothetical protein A5791_15785 [Mycobacterium sp. 852002-51163_SCH5372311]|uniref:hypothetical protein n=1 Tax=Mycobacterium sp. 852002-51163_SCH5372311 TaxID=1834097 RepID=UPI0007FFC458|nr:hypothetical protein [Mycobacterium sp. 852002-51163_SCH5372311]OBF91043.1 hypothetical protein A5791_15785 [Mycobacterium sp. 852002-51163_SCH5372311]
MVDAHTIATFAFAQMRRDPDFGARFPWVRNTVVCVESDLASDVLEGQVAHYFPEGGATIACYYPRDHRMMFIQVGGPYKPDEAPPPPAHAMTAHNVKNELTIGMIVDAIYHKRGGDFSHLPIYGQGRGGKAARHDDGAPLMGEASTREVEKKLALT